MLNSPVTVSSPGMIPSPLNTDPPPAPVQETTRATRRQRAAKTMLDEWIVAGATSKAKSSSSVASKPSSRSVNEDFNPKSRSKMQGVKVTVSGGEELKTNDDSVAPGSPALKNTMTENSAASSSPATAANVSVSAAEALKALERRNNRKKATVPIDTREATDASKTTRTRRSSKRNTTEPNEATKPEEKLENDPAKPKRKTRGGTKDETETENKEDIPLESEPSKPQRKGP